MKFTTEKLIILLVFSTLLATFVYAAGFESVSVVTPEANSNHSGSVLFNVTVDTADNLSNATNATFFFYNYNTGALAYNITIGPDDDTINDTFNVTLNTQTLGLNGIFNLTVNVTNSTGTTQIENSSITNLTLDNIAPSITTFNNPAEGSNYSTGNQILNVTVTDSFSNVEEVMFNVTNGTGDVIIATSNVAGSNDWNATINVTNYAEGSHTLTVWANDTLLNLNNSESVAFTVDRAAPNVTILNSSISGTDTTPTVTFNFTDAIFTQASCTLYLDGTDYGSNTTTLNNTNTDITVNSALSAATYTAEVNCTDGSSNVGNSSTISVTVTSAASSSSSSSSSSGGSSGSSAGGSSAGISTTTSTSHKKIWASIFEGESAEVEIDNENIPVSEVSFGVTDTMYGAWIKVQVKEDLPSAVSEIEETVQSYLYVQTSSTLVNEKIEDVSFDFQVEQEWLEENELSENQVSMYHFNEETSEWDSLETTHTSSDEEYAYYTASAEGFSYFAIAEGTSTSTVAEIEEVEEEIVEEVAEEEAIEEVEEIAEVVEEEASKAWGWILGLVVIAAGAFFLIRWYKEQQAMKNYKKRKKKKR